MALKEYINEFSNHPRPSKKAVEILRISNACGVTIQAVYRWVNGETIPDKLAKEKMAEITGISVTELFPKIES